MIKYLAILSLCILFSGCIEPRNSQNTDANAKYETIVTTNALQSTNFNEEAYVWEVLIFPTNRVQGVK